MDAIGINMLVKCSIKYYNKVNHISGNPVFFYIFLLVRLHTKNQLPMMPRSGLKVCVGGCVRVGGGG